MVTIFNARCEIHAQWEIRNLAIEMYKIVYDICPNVFANKFAPCIMGKCPEGKMSCGKMAEVREMHKQLKKS